MKIKAKVLEYKCMYWGIFCGEAKVKILEGEEKGKIIELLVTDHHKKGQIIDIYRTVEDEVG